jgi:hypothetical protein
MTNIVIKLGQETSTNWVDRRGKRTDGGESFRSIYLGVRSRPLLLRHVKEVNNSALIVATPLRYLQAAYLLT